MYKYIYVQFPTRFCIRPCGGHITADALVLSSKRFVSNWHHHSSVLVANNLETEMNYSIVIDILCRTDHREQNRANALLVQLIIIFFQLYFSRTSL